MRTQTRRTRALAAIIAAFAARAIGGVDAGAKSRSRAGHAPRLGGLRAAGLRSFPGEDASGGIAAPHTPRANR